MELENQKDKIYLLTLDGKYIGWFFENDDPRITQKLLSFSSVQKIYKEFTPVIYNFADDKETPLAGMAIPWAKSIKLRETSFNELYEYQLEKDRVSSIEDMIVHLNRYSEFFDKEVKKTQEIGNYAETVAYYTAIDRDINLIPATYDRNTMVKTDIGRDMGILMGKEIKRLMVQLDEPKLYTQVAIASKKVRMMGLIDFLIIDKHGDYYIIDTKTGAPVIFSKLDNVIDQVVGTYGFMIEENFNKAPKGHYCISGYYKKRPRDEFDNYFTLESETIDLDKKILARRTKPNTREKVIKNFMKKVEVYKIMKENKWI